MFLSHHLKLPLSYFFSIAEVQIKADKAGRGIAWHGWCQAGFSAKYTDDGHTLILGAVGSLAWRGKYFPS